MQIYVLAADVTNYQHLSPINEDDWNVLALIAARPLLGVWNPLPVRVLRDDDLNKDLRPGDFPYLSADAPVFSGRAVVALGDLLKEHGEVLPLRCEEGDYSLFNVTRVVDALDEARSDLRRYTTSKRIADVLRYEFCIGALRGTTIFKLPHDLRVNVYVTEPFRRRVEDAGLEGFDFRFVWSGPEQ